MSFAAIEGQDRAVAAVRAWVLAGRVAHAALFSGPDGVGKERTARALAAALLCEAGPTPEPCGRCGPCRRVEAQAHPDVHLVAPENGVLSIDAIRQLCARLQLVPFEGRAKVAIVRDAHTMTPAAQSALLKTLEEPPGDAVLVLCTAAPQLLLPTVRSRCRLVTFAPLPEPFVRERVASALGTGPDDPAVSLATVLAQGSLGRALEIAAQGLYGERREIVSAVQALSPDRPGAALDLAEAWGGDRVRAGEALEILQLWYRDRALDAVGDERARCLPDLPAAAPMAASEALWALDRLHEARRAIAAYANPQIALERTFLLLAGAREART
jgi:DNA polymerase-3 subunit delta'